MGLKLRKLDERTTAIEGVLDIQRVGELQELLARAPQTIWDLTSAREFDSAAALALWEHWDKRLPDDVVLTDKQRMLFDRISDTPDADLHEYPNRRELRRKMSTKVNTIGIAAGLLTAFGQFLLDATHAIGHPRSLPFKDISAACYRSGVTALPITMIVGFLIGIVLSYLSSLSLRDFGAESFLPMVMGVGVIRELGPLLTAIVLAGRSGSAITAGLGAMRLTQELDALSALGVSHSKRLVLPRVMALAIMTPLLVICTNIAALFGGMMSGWAELDLSPAAFMLGLQNDVPLSDLWIGLFKSVIFGSAIAVIACYFGLSARADTQSLAMNTTRSVVLSISVIILIDAFFAILFRDI